MTTNELKELILWMKDNKIKRFKNAEVEFELSDLAFIEELNPGKPVKEMPLGSNSDMLDTEKPLTKEEEDELLFWSSR